LIAARTDFNVFCGILGFGFEFLTINHETHHKNYQGGVENATEEAQDKRMYATSNSASCPVQAVKFYFSKCDPESKSLLPSC
jgi:hypothetical protein